MQTTDQTKICYRITDDLTVTIELLSNPYCFRLDHLFEMATRMNKKRRFLFVSKVLGKHLAVNPKISLLTGHLLAMRYMEIVHGYSDSRIKATAEAIQTNKNTSEMLHSIHKDPISFSNPAVCIGFAETATALGHAFFASFKDQVQYIHTTREQVEDLRSVIDFEEEHSHATSHRVYALDPNFFQNNHEVILIDDEVTTGKTALNIIRTLKNKYPLKKVFTVVSILDWRTQEHRKQYKELEKELNITINEVSLIEGMIDVAGIPALPEEKTLPIPMVTQEISFLSVNEFISEEMFYYKSSLNENGTKTDSPYLKATGRFGMTKEEEKINAKSFQKIGNKLQLQRKGKTSLVIGTGEFMYIPMKIASCMGDGVYYQSSTRSPIYLNDDPSYLIKQKFLFDSLENPGIVNFLYNIAPNQYDEIFIVLERIPAMNSLHSLIQELKKTLIPIIHVVILTKFQ
jgi:hypothetical protein